MTRVRLLTPTRANDSKYKRALSNRLEMMNSPLKKIADIKIIKIDKSVDYPNISFLDGSILNIYNQYKLNGLEKSDLQNLVGQYFVKADENADGIELVASNGDHLFVGLKDEDYVGPEAMELWVGDNSIFVWN